MSQSFDVIRAEVLRKGLESIANEMAVTLMRTSGSPVVTEAKDFSTCVLDAAGEQIGFVGYVVFHIAPSILGIEAIRRQYDLSELRPGDGFIMNDPHTAGAIHQGDIGVAMPYFHGGKLVGWGHVDEHVLDVGGSAISGFAPEARDCFSEALRFPGLRMIEDGELDREWREFIRTNVRVPGAVLNDIRSMIAAHHTGQQRLSKLIDEFGLDDFRRYSEINKKLTEDLVRAQIAKLPDGEYTSEDWVEYDGHGVSELFELGLRLVIDGDQAILHFSGHPQVDCFVNGTRAVMMGQAMTTLLCQLLYDVPVNAGIWRPFTFDLGPPGTIVNAVPPAPTTQGHMHTGMKVNKLLCDVLSQAASLSADPVMRSRVAGQPSNGSISTTLIGIDRRVGRPGVMFPMSPPHCLGGGAQSTGDGLDTYGSQCTLGNGVPAVEIEESTAPMMVLWRRILANSGGPGAYRGGQGISIGIAIAGADEMRGTAWSSVAEVPSRGPAGGLPGGASLYHIVRKSNLDELLASGIAPSEERLTGTVADLPSQVGSLTVTEGDVFVFRSGGGGGLGDPLQRDPSSVAQDVADGYVDASVAADVYGVSLSPTQQVDGQATAALRQSIRTNRLGGHPPRREVAELKSGDALGVVSDGSAWRCHACREELGTIDTNYRAALIVHESPAASRLAEMAVNVRPRPLDQHGLVLREHFCPACGSCLVVDVTLEDQPPVTAPALR
jgi:N-methylhydantoinase B